MIKSLIDWLIARVESVIDLAGKVIVLVLTLVFGHCQGDPLLDKNYPGPTYAAVRPTEEALAGFYTLTLETLRDSDKTDLKDGVCSIDLRADGSFTATNVPARGTYDPKPDFFKTLIGGSGRWRIDSLGSVGQNGKSHDLWAVTLNPEKPTLDAPFVVGDKPPYNLMFSIGDPDSGEMLILSKTISTSSKASEKK